MKLIIDQGNSRVKIALFHQDQIIEIKSFDNADELNANEIIDEFQSKYPNNAPISAGIFSSVGPTPEKFVEALSGRIHLLILNSKLKLPFKIKYTTPETLGNDRKALAAGAIKLLPNSDILVVDAGTCITYDFINLHNEYLGGSISPGINMRFKALNTFTSNLPLITQINTPDLIGDSTLLSIQSGVINGVKAEVMGIIEQYKSIYPSLNVIFTGGDFKYFDKNAKSNIFAIPNLVLLGLKEILEYNANQ